MSNIKAINYLEEMDEDLKSFLESLEIAIVDEKEHNPAESFIFIGKDFQGLTDSIMFSDREADTYVITMDRHEGDWAEITDLKITLLHYDMMMSETGKVIVARLFSNGTSVQMEKSFGTAMSDMKSFKVSNPLYTGHYSDIAFDYAFEKKKSYLEVRNYLNSLMTFLTYLQQGKYIEIPFDVDIGVTNEGLVLQVVAPVKQLQYDILQKGLSKQFEKEPYGNLLLNCIEIAGYFDIFTVKSSKKVIFTAVWIDSVPSRNFSFKVYDTLDHKIYGADIIASDVVLNYDFNSDTDGIYLPGRFMADKMRGRWFRIVKAQEIKATLDQLKKDEQEFEEHKSFKEYLIEKFDTQFSKDEVLFMHRAHLSDELRTMFSESVFKSKMDVAKLESEIQRIMESLLAVDSVWPDKETKEEVYSEAVMSGITSKIGLVFKKNNDPEKIKKMIMGIFIKEAKLDMRVANKLAEMFVSNGFDLFAVENFKEAFNHESGNTIMDSDEVAELKEKFAEIEEQMVAVNDVNQEFAKESQNDDLLARNKQLSKEVEELQNKLKKKHGSFFNQNGGANKETNSTQLKAKIKNLEAQVRVANQKIEDLSKRGGGDSSMLSAGGGGGGGSADTGGGSSKDSENLISKNVLEVEKQKFAQEKKRLEAKLNTADMRANAEKGKLQAEIERLNKEKKINKQNDNSMQLKKDLSKAQAETKAGVLKMKKLETQNKMLEQQMSKMMAAKSRLGGAGGKGKDKGDPRKDRKIKQLEMLYQKFQKQAEKASKDLLEKKSLLTKQKNEIQLLKNQIKQLQKKAA
jgi:hypothetical protein